MNEEQHRLRKENEELRTLLEEFQSLKEDQLARRVFEKARRLFYFYLTIGGVLLAISGFVGVKSLVDFTRDRVEEKVEEISAGLVSAQCETAVKGVVKKMEPEIRIMAQDKLDAYMATVLDPIVSRDRPQIADLALGGPMGAVVTEVSPMDYSADLPPVRDQGSESCCVAFAVAAALEYSAGQIEEGPVVLSPRFVYYVAREVSDRPLSKDTGLNVRDAVEAIDMYGIIPEEVWPYVAGEYDEPRPPDVESARHYKLGEPMPISGAEELRRALELGPVVAGLATFDALLGEAVWETGIIPMPAAGERVKGAMGVCFVGCDDERQLFKFKNSWGHDWGDDGYGYVSYDYADAYMADAWYLELVAD